MKTGYRKPALLVLMVVMALAWGPVFAADWYVNPAASPGGDGKSWSTAFRTIQQALNAASSIWTVCMAPPDTIHVRGGTYYRNTQLNINKYVRILGGYNNKGIRDLKDYPSIIDGLGETRCLNITAPAILDGFIIRNGATATAGSGGGLYIASTPVYCNTMDFYHVPRIVNCTIENNTADVYGGGVYDHESNTEIENCTFQGNHAIAGGGVHHHRSSITFNRCIFRENTALIGNGGGISGEFNNLTTGGLITITNSLFQDNHAGEWGGAISTTHVFPRINNCTFFNNTAGSSGGAYYGNPNADAPFVYNSIFWDNSPDHLDVVTTNEYWHVSYSNIQGGWTGPGWNNIDEDPVFASPATGDFHLAWGSPCIDSGISLRSVTEDLDGVLRPHDGTGDGTARSDMGAYEYTYTTLLGDFDWDWDVDGRDLRGFGRGFGFRQGEHGYNASLDFDADRRVDTYDLAIFADAYGQMEAP